MGPTSALKTREKKKTLARSSQVNITATTGAKWYVLVAIFRCCWLTIAGRVGRKRQCQCEDFSLSKGGRAP